MGKDPEVHCCLREAIWNKFTTFFLLIKLLAHAVIYGSYKYILYRFELKHNMCASEIIKFFVTHKFSTLFFYKALLVIR